MKELLYILENDLFNVATIPRDKVFTVYDGITDLSVIFVLSIFAVCIIIVTVTLILYVYFHKEPEIRATSVTLSLCMFLGCYILLLYIPLLLIKAQSSEFTLLADVICMLLACLVFWSWTSFPTDSRHFTLEDVKSVYGIQSSNF